MIEYMDGIVEAVKECAERATEVAAEIIIILAKTLILITAPAWILPYAILREIMRDNNGGHCEKPDCENCPFPPCKERRGRE